MFEMRVSAVLLARDGFTWRPVEKNAVRVWLDGRAVRPEYRAGGYFVFINLERGPHEITLDGLNFQTETLSVTVPERGYDERIVSLKPNARYPFGASVTRFKLSTLEKGKPAAREPVIVALRSVFEPKIAQDAVKAGDTDAKLYIRGNPEGLRLPARFLIVDGKESEICTLTEVSDSTGSFGKPFAAGHKRGKALYPCQEYTLDDNGQLTACFREAAEIVVFYPERKRVENVTLSDGENELAVDLSAGRASRAAEDAD